MFDFGKADGELFLAMELIEGKDLRTAMGQAVARDLLPPMPVAAYIIDEVAAGLDYAHRKTDGYGGPLGIVHCDVSPSNVMLSTDGYVKILDFGIARATFASALERRRLRGKPRYMAPEQTLGEPPTRRGRRVRARHHRVGAVHRAAAVSRARPSRRSSRRCARPSRRASIG